MARYIYMVQGCDHKFTTKQEAQDYASFDRWLEFMHDKQPRITIISRLTPKQYKQMQARKQLAQEA